MDSPFNPEFQNKNIDAKIIAAFERIAEVFRVLLWEKSKIIKLSPIQIQILIFLKYHEQEYCTVNYLAEEFNMTAPTISDAVKILFNKGLIKKIKKPQDKRFSYLHLTPKGEKLILQSQSFINALLQTLKEFNQLDKELFLSFLLKIIYDLNSKGVLNTKRMCFTCAYFQSNNGVFYCNLLEMKLEKKDLRIDCPEHKAKV